MSTTISQQKLELATTNVPARDAEHKQLRERLVRLIAEREAARHVTRPGTAGT